MFRSWRWFVIGLLGLTAFSKLLSLVRPTHLLAQTDTIFQIPIKYVILAAALGEIGICTYLWLGSNKITAAFLVFIFAVTVLGYRIALYINGTHFCPCLGNAIDWWPWLGRNENAVLATIAVWLLLISSIDLLQRESGDASFDSKPGRSILMVLMPLGLASMVFLMYSPWKASIYSPNEGIEFSKMLVLFHRPESVLAVGHEPEWSYSRICNVIFSAFGFHLWIPRLITVAIVGLLWITFPRLMPYGTALPHLIFALLFFCAWPAGVTTSISASSRLSAVSLAVISAALLPRREEDWRWRRLLLSCAILTAALWINPVAAIVVPGIALVLLQGWWDRLKTRSSSQVGSGQRRLIAGCGTTLFAISFCGISWGFPFDGHTASGGHPTTTFPQMNYLLTDLWACLDHPGTTLACLLGLTIVWKQLRLREVLCTLALLATILLLHILRPEWRDYGIFLAIPVSILAGFCTAELLSKAVKNRSLLSNTGKTFLGPPAAAMIGALIVSLWFTLELPEIPQEVDSIHTVGIAADDVATVLDDYRGQINWIYTKNNALAAWTGYLLPPELIDLYRWQSGNPVADEKAAVNVVKHYKCEILIFPSLRGEFADGQWAALVQQEYTKVWSNPNETIFIAKRLNPKPYARPDEVLKDLL